MRKKLKACRGETLTETLAAILMVALSAVVLCTLAVTAARINRAAGEGDARFRQNQAVVERQRPDADGTLAQNGSVTITVNGAASTYPVTIYTMENGDLTSYVYREGGGA